MYDFILDMDIQMFKKTSEGACFQCPADTFASECRWKCIASTFWMPLWLPNADESALSSAFGSQSGIQKVEAMHFHLHSEAKVSAGHWKHAPSLVFLNIWISISKIKSYIILPKSPGDIVLNYYNDIRSFRTCHFTLIWIRENKQIPYTKIFIIALFFILNLYQHYAWSQIAI